MGHLFEYMMAMYSLFSGVNVILAMDGFLFSEVLEPRKKAVPFKKCRFLNGTAFFLGSGTWEKSGAV